MLNTESVKHNFKYYHVIHDDVLEVAEKDALKNEYSLAQAHVFASHIRVLEMWKNARLEQLAKQGFDEKDVTEELLWLDIEWPRVRRFSLDLYCESSYKNIFPRIITAGFARQRYIKRNPHTGAQVCDENGNPLVYSTYQDAQNDSYLDTQGEEQKYPGEIIHQALFLSEALNHAIAGLGRPPRPDGGGSPPNTKNEDAQRGPSRGTAEQSSAENPTSSHELVKSLNNNQVSFENIPSPGQKNQGSNVVLCQNSQNTIHPDSQNTPNTPEVEASTSARVHKNTQGRGQKSGGRGQNNPAPLVKMAVVNSNSNNQQLPAEETVTSTGAPAPADILSHFDFFRERTPEAFQDLFALLMPLPAYKADQKETAEEKHAKAVTKTVHVSQDLARSAFLRERDLVYSARLMCYLKDRTSPCTWREEISKKNPRMALHDWVRPWHFTDQVVRRAGLEMEACDWWPSWLPRTTGAPESPANEIQVIDLADLADIAPDQRQGMTRDDALDLKASIEELLPPEEFPGVFLDYGSVERWKPSRGYYVSFWPIDALEIKLYSPADWQLVWANATLLGSPEFVPRLAEACMAGEVA